MMDSFSQPSVHRWRAAQCTVVQMVLLPIATVPIVVCFPRSFKLCYFTSRKRQVLVQPVHVRHGSGCDEVGRRLVLLAVAGLLRIRGLQSSVCYGVGSRPGFTSDLARCVGLGLRAFPASEASLNAAMRSCQEPRRAARFFTLLLFVAPDISS